MKDNFNMHAWQLKQAINELEKTNEDAPIYKDWDEFVNPHYILVTLKNGKKLKIEKKNVKGGTNVYHAILKAFNDNNHKITNKVVSGMLDRLGESVNEEKAQCPDCGCKMEGTMCNECGYMEEGATFTNKHDDNPKLKGGQKDLPDEVQAKIVAKEGEGEDHEVSMAQNSLQAIISSASQLMNKLGDNERNIPGWIQDHIAKSENYIEQANQSFHELEPYGDSDEMNEAMFTSANSNNPEGDKLVLRFLQGIAKKFDYPVAQAALFVKDRIKKLGY